MQETQKVNDVEQTCQLAYDNRSVIAQMPTQEKNRILALAAEALIESQEQILAANRADLKANADKPAHLLDRLSLNEKRIADIAEGLKQLIGLPDPVGEILSETVSENGLKITKIRVPLGVVGIIYEARPNVTVDAMGLCIKSGNAVVLRGSKDAICSNKALVGVVKAKLVANGYNAEFIQLVLDTTHEGAETLMKCRKYVDVLIPRGSANLIRATVEKSTVPVIETGTGNCHAYIESTADLNMAKAIVCNGKLQRQSVCNALESLLIDASIAALYLPEILGALQENGVTVHGCERTCAICASAKTATEEDYYKEYLAPEISCKVVSGIDEAIAHVNRYSTKHSDTIVTNDAEKAEKFLNEVDGAAVYANASTRFTDGFEFGFGAEMGISTQKLHARGPMGLKELTSYKYQVRGSGQTRP